MGSRKESQGSHVIFRRASYQRFGNIERDSRDLAGSRISVKTTLLSELRGACSNVLGG